MKKNYWLTFGICFFIGICFLGCSSTKIIPIPGYTPVFITNTKLFYPLKPENIEHDIDCLQLLDGEFGENKFTLQAYLQANTSGIFLAILNEFGTGMGNLTFDGKNASFDSSVFPDKMKAEYIIADLQFAYYKVPSITKALKKIGLKFVVDKKDGTEVRKIMHRKKCIEQITKSNGTLEIENFLRGYKYNLQEAVE